jgi:hypothetical protein
MLNSLKDIRMVDESKILGEGAFSQVQKVISVKNNQVYALKRVELLGRHLASFTSRNIESEERDRSAPFS